MLDEIWNEDCFVTMENMPIGQCHVILTSPFYNTNKKAGNNRTLMNTKVKDGQYDYVRYDSFVDNINYGAENTEGMFLAVSKILTETNFTIADVIGWKKKTALPNSCSSNRLTRLFEFVFVFCRKDELKSFYCNKKVTSTRKTGQKMYENIYNIIEAPNNSETCPYNKATYSVELCEQLLNLYCPRGGLYMTHLWEVVQPLLLARIQADITSVQKYQKSKFNGQKKDLSEIIFHVQNGLITC